MNLFNIFLNISLSILALAGILSLVRLFRGPNLADRVIVFDFGAALTISLLALMSLRFPHGHFLDAALMLAVLGFVGTVGFASYLERGIAKNPSENPKENKS